MATQVPTITTGLAPYRLTVRQFIKMIEADVFPEDQKVELLGGILYPMVTNDPHDFVVTRLAELLRQQLPADWSLREEKAVNLGNRWRPYPDISVLKSTSGAFARRAPQPRDIALLVEIADSSYRKDAGIKLPGYARARVPLYWIVHLNRRQVEVYSDPQGSRDKANYRLVKLYTEADNIPVVLDGQDLGRIAVRDLLP